MALSKEKFDKYLYIEENTVYTKKPARIIFDLSEYKNISEEVSNNESLGVIDNFGNDIYGVPGFFTLEFPEDNDSINFFFPYAVNIIAPDDSEISSSKLEFNFEENDPVFFAKFKKEETDIRILDKLFENGQKYLTKDMNLLINSIWKQLLPTMNVPYHHIETILTNLFLENKNGMWIPVRLGSQEYSKETAVNTKKAAHRLNKFLGFLYGYSNDALLEAVMYPDRFEQESLFEKMITGEFAQTKNK